MAPTKNFIYHVRNLLHLAFLLSDAFVIWLSNLVVSFVSNLVENRSKYPLVLSSAVRLTEKLVTKKFGYTSPLDLGIESNFKQHSSDERETIEKALNEFVRRQIEDHHALNSIGFRIVSGTLTSAFGHMSHGLELLKMAKELNVFGDDKLLILQQKSANAYYLDHWTKHFSVLTMSDRDAAYLTYKFGQYVLEMDWIPNVGRENLWGFELYNYIKGCHKEKFGEISPLQPKLQSKKALKEWFSDLGYNPNSWHVVFHVREKKEVNGREYSNADVKTFTDSINEVIERGGLAILIGENEGFPLAEKPGFINYARRKEKSEILNMAILSLCKFLVGTSSGPLTVPPTFGIPILYTNNPRVGLCFRNKGLCITKKIQEVESGRILKFEEQSQFDLNIGLNAYKGKFKYLNNTAEEILNATRDMFDLFDGLNTEWSITKVNSIYLDGLGRGMEFAPSFIESNQKLLN